MNAPAPIAGDNAWSDALFALACVAVAPARIGGLCVRSPAPALGHALDRYARAVLPTDAPLRRLPSHIGEARLLGGLDLAATLRSGRPVIEAGLLAQAHDGIVVVPMAERLASGLAALTAAAMDGGEIRVDRAGLSSVHPARFGLLLIDEGRDWQGDDPREDRPPAILLERIACLIDLSGVQDDTIGSEAPDRADVAAARTRLARVRIEDEALKALCVAAYALGVDSLRVPIRAIALAKASAALKGEDVVGRDDVAFAARMVLAPRATRIPTDPAEQETTRETDATDIPPPPAEDRSEPTPPSNLDAPGPEAAQPDANEQSVNDGQTPLQDVVLAAAKAAIPADLLSRLRLAQVARSQSGAGGSSGDVRKSANRGRIIGSRAGELRGGARLNLIETLRAAAPWQTQRRRARAEPVNNERLIDIRREDVRVSRFRQLSPTTTIFAVDASGSAALDRLAEAKGAVELLLADCYIRRDQVAVLAFRGARAEMLLPATRSLQRAKRALAGLPGGGGTPLAAGIELAMTLGLDSRRRGQTPTIVFLTDGRANVDRAGIGGRSDAERDAHSAARRLRDSRLRCLVVDSSARPEPRARRLALEMGALYVALPRADSRSLSRAVQSGSAA